MLAGNVGIFILGLLLGAGIVLAVSELISRRSKRELEVQNIRLNEGRIIEDSLKFLFRANDILNDLWVDKEVWFKFHKDMPEKSFEFEQRLVRRFDDNTHRDFFNELMFHSFRLKMLRDGAVRDDFDRLMSTFKEFSERLLLARSPEDYADLDKRYSQQKNDFLAKCAGICK